MSEYNYITDAYVHTSIHRALLEFDPSNSANPLTNETLDNRSFRTETINRIRDIANIGVNPYITAYTASTPDSFRLTQQIILMKWSHLINTYIFTDNLYNIFYCEYKHQLDNVVKTRKDSIKSVLFREYKTGLSIFHIAAKLRLLDRMQIDSNLSLGQKINGLDKELNYIFKCYRDFGCVLDEGNELTIPYIEDFSGLYLVDYLGNFVDDLINSSIF